MSGKAADLQERRIGYVPFGVPGVPNGCVKACAPKAAVWAARGERGCGCCLPTSCCCNRLRALWGGNGFCVPAFIRAMVVALLPTAGNL